MLRSSVLHLFPELLPCRSQNCSMVEGNLNVFQQYPPGNSLYRAVACFKTCDAIWHSRESDRKGFRSESLHRTERSSLPLGGLSTVLHCRQQRRPNAGPPQQKGLQLMPRVRFSATEHAPSAWAHAHASRYHGTHHALHCVGPRLSGGVVCIVADGVSWSRRSWLQVRRTRLGHKQVTLKSSLPGAS